MDFEGAVSRLAKDQSKVRERFRRTGGGGTVPVSAKAKRQAELQRKQREQLQQERERKRKLQNYQKQYMHSCDRVLHVKSLQSQHHLLQTKGVAAAAATTTTTSTGNSLQLKATSIYGNGDKITLPPSVLETLTSYMESNLTDHDNNTPWTFRIGILNPDYQFPSSPLIHTLKAPADDYDYGDSGDMAMDSDSDDDDDDGNENHHDSKVPYLDELSYKYLVYTHCTVVEFTQDEGHVGIPKHIASVLLNPRNHHFNNNDKSKMVSIPTTRTIDPATAVANSSLAKTNEEEDDMDVDITKAASELSTAAVVNEGEEDQTPGHVAWGAFDLPDMPLEITLVKLPKGRACTLVPTRQAIQHGFYNLKDVKLVLEQSLIRTRATLSVGDVVSTWHRGVQYDLTVTRVAPSGFGAVTCINTDIEVDIGPPEETNKDDNSQKSSHSPTQQRKHESSLSDGYRLGTGRTLTSPSSSSSPKSSPKAAATSKRQVPLVLLPEPPTDQTENVCNVQIRYSGGNGKRRFDVQKATVKDLMEFASSLLLAGQDEQGKQQELQFQLVTRFPRRVFSLEMRFSTLAEAGIQAGQELFMVEMSP